MDYDAALSFPYGMAVMDQTLWTASYGAGAERCMTSSFGFLVGQQLLPLVHDQPYPTIGIGYKPQQQGYTSWNWIVWLFV